MKIRIIITLITILALGFLSCSFDSETGVMKLSLTDAPTDAENITGVYITIDAIQYNKNQNGSEAWEPMEEFQGPQTYNLLELQDGESALLGELVLDAGQYNQIRFMLDIPEQSTGTPSNPGCYLEYADETTEPLFVPSGGNTGYKTVGAFQVPQNGTVELTADFDVRKAVVEAGTSGIYILKPTIRLIADTQAGKIAGSLTNYSGDSDIIIFAYESGSYEETEAAEPEAGEARFPNAITSAEVKEDGSYTLWYLAEGTYDLICVEYADGAFVGTAGIVSEVAVESEKTTTQKIDFSLF